MPRRRGVMSDQLKWELAKELGVADIVAREGFGGVSSRNCGNLVRLAIERAERAMAATQQPVVAPPVVNQTIPTPVPGAPVTPVSPINNQ